MNKTTQVINAYLNGELEECELISFQEEVHSDEALEMAVSNELLKMMKAERDYRINELNTLNGGVMPNKNGMRKNFKTHNPMAHLLQFMKKRS